MVLTGFETIRKELPGGLKGKRVGIVCHAPSISSDFEHIVDFAYRSGDIHLGAVFGPQHGLYGQTQDNMIEWEGTYNEQYGANIYSLYGEHRKPTEGMLRDLDAIIVDLQDVGARPYTYIWTMRLCMETAGHLGIPVWVLDRPNPIAAIDFDGAVLKRDYYTFVGMAAIPLCHRMTIGEIALWIRDIENVKCNLNVVQMTGWDRKMMFSDTGLPWVIPSPNMPTQSTAAVYPGMVLTEATNLSEARGTTIPFELTGAPWVKIKELLKYLDRMDVKGCSFREHNYIPTFHKYVNKYCFGLQVHVTDIASYRPVFTAMTVYKAIIDTSGKHFNFLDPPYEYEYNLVPFDILSGDDSSRKCLLENNSLESESEKWSEETNEFTTSFNQIKIY